MLSTELCGEEGQFSLSKRDGEKVNLLWASPVTLTERELAEAGENGGNRLIERLRKAGASHIFRPRHQVSDSQY